ncbi:hypothetical protein KP509_34G051700 [Ceratopteris richardii]|uniref:Uncharacterized protein n=1 Tax=Ceratopteris richardii TaxID=49495 RepID=A0A8T2QKP0_CERRI|nr:hypothetical protein KP509_34G051700 [Ceratopteris richardii]
MIEMTRKSKDTFDLLDVLFLRCFEERERGYHI